ncbi:endoplasmic oxidoreductin [Saccharata proteae CBS 121410]|uniref:Endoplasmic oxidoreductin n=1 Tax=Saccharata proteae CBS 121410 TaxID=1314787 RepID=A0A9P4HTB1_9PEZI|nr:endoplasmic oxidoreductin [Saccharata proteae CBS 121410]
MRRSAQLFYLAVFALLGTSHGSLHSSSSKGATKSNGDGSPNVCAFEPGAIVSDACASYSSLEDINDNLAPYLEKITQDTDFFSYYRLNLYNKKCPFWSDEDGMCGNIACAVNTLENEDDIPLVWRAEELGKLEGPKAQHPGRKQREEHRVRPLQGELGEEVGESCVVEYDDECDDRDYCIPDDEGASAKGDYVSLVDNPERFTGYMGPSAQQVWEAIYRENCFSKPQTGGHSSPDSSLGSGFSNGRLQASQDLRNVMRSQPLQQNVQSAIAGGGAQGRVDSLEFDDECLEKRVFYRVISGMHASISTHLCYEYLNQTTGQWGPNLSCYEQRLHDHPERISNLYFNYALVLRAVGKLKQHLNDYQFCSADPDQDTATKDLVLQLASAIPAGPDIFDETVMFTDETAGIELKEDFRNRFRNVSRVMDCVGCDKCRLWGKLQTAGYGTALKVLFEFDEKDSKNDPPLRRTELVALVNTLGRISHSLSAIKEFRDMIEARDAVAHIEAIPTSTDAGRSSPTDEAEVEVGVDNDEEEEDEDEYPEFLKHRAPPGETVWESFANELSLVYQTFCWVIGRWMALPGKMLKIFIVEISRLWDWWLGMPVKPRSWEFRFPTRREL